MTTQQLYLFNLLGIGLIAVLALLTRAPGTRIAGAVVGAAATGAVGLPLVALGESRNLWRMAITWEPGYLLLLLAGFAVGGYVFLLTWRIARRFGARGLLLALLIAAIVGPFRDSWYLNHFPEWGVYAPGLAPLFGVSAIYVLMGIVGHGVMRLVAGPAENDALARRPWELRLK